MMDCVSVATNPFQHAFVVVGIAHSLCLVALCTLVGHVERVLLSQRRPSWNGFILSVHCVNEVELNEVEPNENQCNCRLLWGRVER